MNNSSQFQPVDSAVIVLAVGLPLMFISRLTLDFLAPRALPAFSHLGFPNALNDHWFHAIVSSVALLLAIGMVYRARRRARYRESISATGIFTSHIFFAALIPLSLYFLVIDLPVPDRAAWRLLLICSLLPLLAGHLWFWLERGSSRPLSWQTGFLLPWLSFLIPVFLLEVTASVLLKKDVFHGAVAESSDDRRYWYIKHKAGSDGANLANSFGFLGHEPLPDPQVLRVLMIGDSMPDAARPGNMVEIAQAVLSKEWPGQRIEMFNAAHPGYSSEQILLYYKHHLQHFDHDVVVVGYHLDDVNRELRYRKRNYLYNPLWPERFQDLYYACYLCKSMLKVLQFNEADMITMRSTAGISRLSASVSYVEQIRRLASTNGRHAAVLMIPTLRWEGILERPEQHEHHAVNVGLYGFWRRKEIDFLDLLPMFKGYTAQELRISERNAHFNDLGHQLSGEILAGFVHGLLQRHQVGPK